MQLDQTRLVMRPRSMSEVGDLTLAMLRCYPRLIFQRFVLGAGLWALLNLLLLSWIPIREWRLGLNDDEAIFGLCRYISWMTLLVILQTPIAGSIVTLSLGKVIFEEKLNWRGACRELWGHRGALIEILAMQGLVLPVMLIALIRIGSPASMLWDLTIPVLTIVVLFFTRGMNPFKTEIILLEKCPIRKRKIDHGETVKVLFGERSSHLHQRLAGENGGRFIVQGFTYFLLAAGIMMSIMAVRGILLLRWDFMDLPVLLLIFPASLWIVAAISVIVRLLLYLDTRLRLEGWDVELLVRAEVIRQFGSTSPQGNRPAVKDRDVSGSKADSKPQLKAEDQESSSSLSRVNQTKGGT